MAYLPEVPDEAAVPIAKRIREHEEVWVAEEEGRLLGFLGIEESTTSAGAGAGEALRRSRGAEQGHRSGPAREGEGASAGRLLSLGVPEERRSRRLYERTGFQLVKLTDGADNMEREPDALYRGAPESPFPRS